MAFLLGPDAGSVVLSGLTYPVAFYQKQAHSPEGAPEVCQTNLFLPDAGGRL